MSEAASQEYIERLKSQDRSNKQIDQILESKGLHRPTGYGTSLVRSVAQGVSLGFADELESGVRTGFGFAGDYEETRDQIRSENKQWSDENPGAAIGSEMAGGLATGLVGGAKWAGGKLLQTGAPTLMKYAGLGALEGGVSGAGHSESIENLPQDIVTGAAVGGAIGGVMSPAQKAVQAIASKMPEGRTAQTMREVFTDSGMDTADDVKRALDDVGEGGIIGDISESAGARFRPAVMAPGAGREDAKAFLRNRQAQQSGQVENLAYEVAGTRQTTLQRMDDLLEQRSNQATQDYERVMQMKVRPTAGVIATLTTRDGKKAFRESVERYNARRPGNPVEWTEMDAPYIQDLRFWDGFKKRLSGAENRASVKGDKDAASYIAKMRRTVTDAFDDQTTTASGSQYKTARDNFAKSSRAAEAITMGKKIFFKSAGTDDDIVRKVRAMETEEKREFLLGVMEEVRDRILRKPEDANSVRQFVAYPSTQRKLRAAFDDDKAFNAFNDRLVELSKQGNTANLILSGSRTAEVEAEKAARDLMGAGASLAQGEPVTAVAKAGRTLMQKLSGENSKAANKKLVEKFLMEGDAARRYIDQVFSPGMIDPRLPIAGGSSLIVPAAGLSTAE